MTYLRKTLGLGTLLGATALAFVSGAYAAGDAAQGQALYTSKGCVACHSIDGTPRVGPSLKGLDGKKGKVTVAGAVQDITVDDAYLKESIQNPNAKIVQGFPPVMIVATPLTDAEIDHVIAYIKTLK